MHSRRLIVERVLEEGWTVAAAAEAAGVSTRTAAKWLARYRSEGLVGLGDRSSAPRRVPRRTPAERVRLIEQLRRLRMTSAAIAEELRDAALDGVGGAEAAGAGEALTARAAEPPNRYECRRPGELIHIDIKKLGRFTARVTECSAAAAGRYEEGAGYEYVHVGVDDYSRLAYVEVLDDERATTAVGFLRRALAWFAARGVRRRTRDDRQRLGLPVTRPRRLACARARHPTHRAPGRTGPAPTAKPNASSKPCSTAGPTHASTPAATNEPSHSHCGSTTTTTARPHGGLGHRTTSATA